MKIGKRLLSLLLCFVMLVGLMPTSVFAAGTKLETPQNLKLQGTVLSWDAVDNADFYGVTLYHPNYVYSIGSWQTDGTSINLYKYLKDGETYGATVIACSNGSYQISTPAEIPLTACTNAGVPIYRDVNVVNGTSSNATAYPGMSVRLEAKPAPDGMVFDRWELSGGYINIGYSDTNTVIYVQAICDNDISARATYKYQENVTSAFTVQPQGGAALVGESFNVTYAMNFTPQGTVKVQVEGNTPGDFSDLKQGEIDSASISEDSVGTKTFRIMAFDGTRNIYSDEFVVSWEDGPRFVSQPMGGTVDHNVDFVATYALNFNPFSCRVERYSDYLYQWVELSNASATEATIGSYDFNTSSNYRIKAIIQGGGEVYSDEFTVTWSDAVSKFIQQPVGGTVGFDEDFTFTFAINFTPASNVAIQKYNSGFDSWDTVGYCTSLTSGTISGYASETTNKYRLEAYENGTPIHSNEFTVTWEDDTPQQPTTYGINCCAWNLTDNANNAAAGTVSVQTDKGSQSGSAAFGSATENTSVTVTATANSGYEFIGWRKSVPANAGATVSTNASYTFNATENVWLYAVFQQQPTEISTINITGIPTPTAGASPDVTGIATDTAGITLGTIQWQYGSGNVMNANNGDTFAAGTTYMLYVGYSVDNGYEKAQQVAVTTPNFTPDNNGVEVNHAWIGIKYTIPAPQPTMYNVAYDANGGSGAMNGGEVAENGTFTLDACGFTAPDGQQFKAWAIGSPTGEQKQPGAQITITGDTTIYAIWEDIPQQPTEITSVTATVSGATAGATAGSTTVTTNDSTYTVSIKNWYDCDNVFNYGSAPVLQSSDTFVGGKTYTVAVTVTPVGNTVLADASNITVKINGEDGKIGGGEGNNSRNYFITVTVPAVQPTMYNVAYDANSGSGTMNGGEVAENGTFTLDACGFTAPAGQQFKAWAIGSVNGEQKQPSEQITITGHTTIYAIWEDIPQQPPTATLTDIVITTPPTKTTYTAGESFDPTGMVVTAYYSDQSSRPLSNNEYTYAPAGALTANDTEITVTYDDGLGTIKTAEQAITVSPAQPAGHTHDYGREPNNWDATHHWKECTDQGCPDRAGSIEDKAPHADSDGDGYCDDCDVEVVKVSFVSNGGSGTMADVFVEKDANYTLPGNGFTAPSGKWFKCWSVGGVEKAVGAVITVAANTTVTAVWAGNTYNPRPNYPIYINPTPGSSSTGQIIAAKTFDGGIGLSVAVTILSAMGGAWLAKKKED